MRRASAENGTAGKTAGKAAGKTAGKAALNKAIDIFGKYLSEHVRTNPLLVRRLLAAAYSGIDVAKNFRGADFAGVSERYVGAIGGVIARGLRHPERCALVNIFMPPEILEAFDLVPLFPEGISVYAANTSCSAVFADAAEAANVPDTFCSYHKVMIGMVETGVIGRPAFVANTTLACDANQVSFRRVATHLDVPQIVIDVPCHDGEDAVSYVEEQLYEMAARVEDICGRRLDADALSAAMARTAKTVAAMRRYREMRAQVSLPSTLTSVFCELVATHCLASSEESVRFAEGLERVAREERKAREERLARDGAGAAPSCVSRIGTSTATPSRLSSAASTATPSRLSFAASTATPSRLPRIFWIHTLPNWQFSMRDIFDGGGGAGATAEIVGVDLALDSNLSADIDHPFKSMASRIVNNVNSGFGERRIECALSQAKQARADGAIIFGHWGCKQTLGLSALIKQTFEAEGIPTLVLDGDGCDPRNVADGQMITRANAFIEQLGKSLEGVN